MKCSTFLSKLDSLDVDETMDSSMNRHIDQCSRCQRESRALLMALAQLAHESTQQGEDVCAPVMEKIRTLPVPHPNPSLREWAIPAVIIVISIVLSPIAESTGTFNLLFGQSSYPLWLALVLGLSISVYGAIFVATHLREVEDFLNKCGLRPR